MQWLPVVGRRQVSFASGEMLYNRRCLRLRPHFLFHFQRASRSLKIVAWLDQTIWTCRALACSCSFFPLFLDVSGYLGGVSMQPRGGQKPQVSGRQLRDQTKSNHFTQDGRIEKETYRLHDSGVQVTYLSPPFLLAIVLADILKLDATRTRRLAVASGSHTMAMVAGSADSPFDWSRAPALEFWDFSSGDFHGWGG